MNAKTNEELQDEENSEKNDNKSRRSSLQVNVSYTFDLSDSEKTDGSQNEVNKNKSTASINGDISRLLTSISNKDEALSKNCSRLRDAILNKTRELFDKQNDFCQMTTKVLTSSSQKIDSQHKEKCASPIIRSSRKCNSDNKLSPRKTRASTARERLNSIIASNSQTVSNDIINDVSNVGSPLICSTFIENRCNIHESCNVKKLINSNVNCREHSTRKSNVKTIDKNTFTSKRVSRGDKKKLSIRKIEVCNIMLDKVNEFPQVNKSKTLEPVSMELTNIQGNCILNKSPSNSSKIDNIKEPTIIPPTNSMLSSINRSSTESLSNLIEDVMSNECSKTNYSLRVNTSVDNQYSHDEKLINRRGETSGQDQKRKVSSKETGGNATVCNTNTIIDLSVDSDDIYDMPLILRSRNISHKNNTDRLRIPTPNINNKSVDIVEGTPFPISRSMLLRTQAKLNSLEEKTKLQFLNESQLKNPPSKANSAIDTEESAKTIILNNIAPLCIKNPSTQELGIIQETSDEELDSTIESNDNLKSQNPLKRPIVKKKLFTQHDSSEPASITPLSNDVYSPKVTKLKRIKRRRIKRNVVGRIIKPLPASRVSVSQRYPLTQIILTSSSTSSVNSELRDNKKPPKPKRIIKSKKFVVKKGLRPNLSNAINDIDDTSCERDSQPNWSPDVFMSKKQIRSQRYHGNDKIIIVATGLCNSEKYIVKNAVKKLSGAKMESSVTRKTTHVVTTGVRTINLLRGIIRGCWLVKYEWVKKSLEAGKWVSPENYEIDHFSKAVEENRRDRETFGRSYVPDLFATCGLIYIENNTTPPKEILKELIKTAGGLVVEEPKKSKIIIGQEGIKENWVLDSITTGELQLIESYRGQERK